MIVCVLLVSNSRGCCLAVLGDHEGAAMLDPLNDISHWLGEYLRLITPFIWEVKEILARIYIFLNGIPHNNKYQNNINALPVGDYNAISLCDSHTHRSILNVFITSCEIISRRTP